MQRFSKGGFSNNRITITHELLNPPLLNPPFVNSRFQDDAYVTAMTIHNCVCL